MTEVTDRRRVLHRRLDVLRDQWRTATAAGGPGSDRTNPVSPASKSEATMSDHSRIGWTSAIWNPVTGCERPERWDADGTQ